MWTGRVNRLLADDAGGTPSAGRRSPLAEQVDQSGRVRRDVVTNQAGRKVAANRTVAARSGRSRPADLPEDANYG
jgi:hypothetical protein